MDPTTFVTAIILGGMFVASQLAGRSAKKKGPAEPAESNGKPPEKRMGGGDPGITGDDAGGQARVVPVEHLRMSDVPAASPAPAEPQPVKPPVTLSLVRDSTGKFRSSRATVPPVAA